MKKMEKLKEVKKHVNTIVTDLESKLFVEGVIITERKCTTYPEAKRN
jgi:hypothetical protein